MTITSLNTVRDYVKFNELQKPKDYFVICSHTNIKVSNKDFRKNLDKINYYLTVKKKQKKESIICTLIENSLSSIHLMLGIMYSGMIQVPLNIVAGEEQLSYVVNHSDAKIIFVSLNYLDLAQKITSKASRDIEIIKINKDTFVDQLETSQKEIKVDIDQQDPALLIYTSGTTGKPKGVMLSHNNILAGGKNVSLSHNIKTNDRALCVLPLFHINGAIVTIIGPLVSQSSLVLCERFSVTNFWKFISKFKCTWFSVVPTIISALLNKTSENEINGLDLSSLRFGRSASAALAPETHKITIKFFNIIYEVLDFVNDSLSGLLKPDIKEQAVGSAEVQTIFTVSKVGKVAGSKVINGEIVNNLNARLIRDGNVLYTGSINSIYREKDAAKQVSAGLECGITLKDFADFKEKDVIEVYKVIETERRI